MFALRRSIFVIGFACFVVWLLNPALFAEVRSNGEVATSQSVRTVADGTLHDCQIVSLDRTLAVGDRGLILNRVRWLHCRWIDRALYPPEQRDNSHIQ
jgi:hypothetical protein